MKIKLKSILISFYMVMWTGLFWHGIFVFIPINIQFLKEKKGNIYLEWSF